MYSEITRFDVGWCADDPQGSFAFRPPRTVFETRDKPLSTRAVQNCPAVNAIERCLIEMPSPVTLRLRAEEDEDGPSVYVIPDGTFVHEQALPEFLTVEPKRRWRDPRRPVVQIRLPFFFVLDTPAEVVQLPPFLGSELRRWPGRMIAGRFPAHIWPRNLSWPFEFDEFGVDLALRAGDPLCYFMFETGDPHARPNLVEAELTPELADYRARMDKVGEITQDIPSIWDDLAAQRPARLLTPVGA